MINEDFEKQLKKAFNEPAKINVKKGSKEKAVLKMEGTVLSILVTLAGIEKSILEHFNISDVIWYRIKSSTKQEGTKK